MKALLTASFLNPEHFFNNTIEFIQVLQIKKDTQGHFTNHICTVRQTDAVREDKDNDGVCAAGTGVCDYQAREPQRDNESCFTQELSCGKRIVWGRLRDLVLLWL